MRTQQQFWNKEIPSDMSSIHKDSLVWLATIIYISFYDSLW